MNIARDQSKALICWNMPLHIIRYKRENEIGWAAKTDEVFVSVSNEPSLGSFLQDYKPRSFQSQLASGGSKVFKRGEIEVLSPVTSPCSIVCQGKNYMDHVIETGASPRSVGNNIFFSKAHSAIMPSQGVLYRPQGVRLLDYEVELGLVLGKTIRDPISLRPDELGKAFAGVVMGNDISARDIQLTKGQWFHGKSFRGFCPIGPYLCLLEENEWPKIDGLQLELTVNGEVRQRARVSQMLHKPAQTISELSTFLDFAPGDLVLTGTPGGVAMNIGNSLYSRLVAAFSSPGQNNSRFLHTQLKCNRYLKDGDVIRASIKGDDRYIDLGIQEVEIKGQPPGGFESVPDNP